MRQDSFRLFQSHISCYIPLSNGNINLKAFFSKFRISRNCQYCNIDIVKGILWICLIFSVQVMYIIMHAVNYN